MAAGVAEPGRRRAASYAHIVINWLVVDGLRVPGDIGVAVDSTPFGDATISGIDENVRAVGAMAVDTVVGMIHRNETGIPTTPWQILAEGTWYQGQAVRACPHVQNPDRRP